MICLSLLLLSFVFIELFIQFDVNGSIRSLLRISQDAYAIILSPELEDAAKEKLIRRRALDMFRATLFFFVKIVLICLAVYALYRLFLSLFSLSEDQVIAASFLLSTIVALLVAGFLYVRLRNVIVRRLQSR